MQLIEQAGRTPICLPWRTFDERIEAYTNCSIAILTDREMSRKLERKEVKNMEEKKAKKGRCHVRMRNSKQARRTW